MWRNAGKLLKQCQIDGKIGTRSFRSVRTSQKTRKFHQSSSPKIAASFGGTISIIGAGFAVYYIANAKSSVHEYVFGPLVRVFLDGEEAHRAVIKIMSLGLFPRLFTPLEDPDNLLKVEIFQGTKQLSSPFGMAAGFDKNAEAVDAIFNLGFSYVEVGSITPLPQPGNPKPRFFRINLDQAVINRYGFNSDGHWSVLSNLRLRLEKLLNEGSKIENNSVRKDSLLAVNLGKNKYGDEVEDYKIGVSRFGAYADALVINVSSPNTPGLRNLQKVEKLSKLLNAVVEERDKINMNENPYNPPDKTPPPILVKIAPDLSETELESIAQAVNQSKINGIIISNTTISRPTIYASPNSSTLQEAGGLSGKPLKPITLKTLKTFVKYNKDPSLTIIGCGGISSGEDAIEFAKAGADFIQLYTGFAYKGPNIVNKIQQEVLDLLRKENKTWSQLVKEAREL